MAQVPAKIKPGRRVKKRVGPVLKSETIDRSSFGPAMEKLTERQKDFVVAYWQTDNATEAARRAGYKADNPDAIKAQAWRLTHDPKIKAALQEFAGNVLSAEGIKRAIKTHLELMDGDIDPKVRLAAAKSILDRTGIVAATQQNINVNVTLTREEKVAKLAELAMQAGLDPKDVLGAVVDLEPEEFGEVDDG
jgi:phage terminase small subunit